MKYPDDFINKIICGDCLEVMKGMPDECVDLIMCDAPYGEKQAEWDGSRPDLEVWTEFYRLLINGGVLYYWGFWGHADWVLSNAKNNRFFPQSQITWWFRTGRPEKKSYREDTESCWYFSKGEPKTFHPEGYLEPYEDKANYKRYGRRGKHPGTVWIASRILHNHPENVGHITQKPLSLIKKIVEISSEKQDIILDPFLGSGTTVVACKDLHRNFIGIEINPDYCKIAEERLTQGVL